MSSSSWCCFNTWAWSVSVNSVHIWDPTIKPPSNRGRKRNNAEEWNDVPDVVKEANIVPNQVDYHGNFTAEIFEDLFSTLCETLQEKYGSVCIHMDGASYHKRRVEKQYEHEVNFTPPYHCKLQPIEGVWSVVKGEVARSGPHPNLLSVKNTLLNAFKEKISSKVIVGLWRRALKNAKEYFESDESIQLIYFISESS
ncbi:hypothetical protein RhiirA4_463452 [Rhizophagus irregularis]|uniref:Tc1-like transposase DDE domain-containing protein n=1 Tax=Rhizophagus irregularis TaxID=588596 RepID=A0A2I1GN20_9GLOM|nr:hypothetical protein RhiirA4_463452 [Rhizophagus irregularis]